MIDFEKRASHIRFRVACSQSGRLWHSSASPNNPNAVTCWEFQNGTTHSQPKRKSTTSKSFLTHIKRQKWLTLVLVGIDDKRGIWIDDVRECDGQDGEKPQCDVPAGQVWCDRCVVGLQVVWPKCFNGHVVTQTAHGRTRHSTGMLIWRFVRAVSGNCSSTRISSLCVFPPYLFPHSCAD